MKLLLLIAAIMLSPVAAFSFQTQYPTRPQSMTDTAPQPSTGKTIIVASGGDLQEAINRAEAGDRLELESGATFTGNFYLKDKHHITITASPCAMPSEGQRVNLSYKNNLPKILTPNNAPALDLWLKHDPDTQIPVHDIRFTGIYIGVVEGIGQVNTLVKAGGVGWQTTKDVQPYNIVFDRCIASGNSDTNLFRAFTLNCASWAVVNSWVDECHVIGQDSQCILSYNGSGAGKICNNELRGAGENVMFGGADSRSPDLIPSDIEICHNHFYKPLSWRVGDPSYAGRHWSIKNLLELKCARRVYIHDNVLENNWLDGQVGHAVLFTPRNQSGGAAWSTVEDVDFENNVIKSSASGFQLLGTDYNYPSGRLQRLRIANNTLLDIDGQKYGGGYGAFIVTVDGTKDVLVEGNIVSQTGSTIVADGTVHLNWTYRNNRTANGGYGVIGSNYGEGNATLGYYFPNIVFTGNTLVGRPETAYSNYPGNFFPSN